MKCKQLAIRYQCMKGFSPQKVDRKLVLLARTLGLHLKTLTPKRNCIYWPLARSCIRQSCSYIISRFCSGMLLLSIFFAARCWQISSKQLYLMSGKPYILQHQAKRWSGGLFGSDRRYIIFRAWLHGEFQPGVKFRSVHRAEILLRLHGQFQPGRKTPISVRKFTEVRKHNRYACSRSFFSPGWKNHGDYMDFSARLAGLKILARYSQTGLGFSARAELHPGWIPLHVIDNLVFRGFVSEAGLKFQPGMKLTICM